MLGSNDQDELNPEVDIIIQDQDPDEQKNTIFGTKKKKLKNAE